MKRRLRILHVANKRLPPNDYRVSYAHLSRVTDVSFGLPECPSGVGESNFVRTTFREGIGLHDVTELLRLCCHLVRHRRKYDSVHFYSTKLQLFGPLCAWLAGLPSLITVTGFGRTFNRSELKYRLLRGPYLALMTLALGLVRAALFQNHGDMHWLAQRIPSLAGRMHWVGSGVDSQVVTSKDFGASPLQVLMVARLMTDKGVPVFCEAARRLAGPAFRFVLAGPVSDGQEIVRQRVVEEQQRGTIEYCGELEHPDLCRLYAASHVFAFPSRGEGMPRVMLEAGHALLCPLASDIPAHRELVGQDRGFLLTPDSQVESLVFHLARLNEDRVTLEDKARRFQGHILREYTLSSYAQRLDDLVQRLFSQPIGASSPEIAMASVSDDDIAKVADLGGIVPSRAFD